MANIKGLMKDTVIYGVSSIFGRFLNYLLTPLYTYKITAESGGYGDITNIYAWTGLILVILTFGMETTFFRFANKHKDKAESVYSTTLIMVTFVSAMFVLAVLAMLPWIAPTLGYAAHPSYLAVMAIVVALDAIQAIPFAYLRFKKRPYKFVALKLLFIVANVLLNLVFFWLLPKIAESNPDAVSGIYDPSVNQGYAFYINLFCTGMVTFFFWKELFCVKMRFDKHLVGDMLRYTWPLLLLGIAGILNQTADKIIFPFVYTASDAQQQLGIYGACVKIAMIMALITQAFRYAYEPLIFGTSEDRNNPELQAKGTKLFIILTMLAFIAVVAWIDVLKFLVGEKYREALYVVPIVMVAEIMMGVYFNLSFWYKLTDKTYWGAIFSGIGCAVLIAVNVIFVPRYSYVACAWGGVAGYFTAMVASYIVGRKRGLAKLPLVDIAFYVAVTAMLFVVCSFVKIDNVWLSAAVKSVTIIILAAIIFKKENAAQHLKKLPVVGRFFR